MIQVSSAHAYEDIMRSLPDCCRPVYKAITENPNICIGEIGRLLEMQNSTVSGRVNDLIADGLVHYVLTAAGIPQLRFSRITGKSVQQLKANDVFTVDVAQIKARAKLKPAARPAGPEQFKTQGDMLSLMGSAA